MKKFVGFCAILLLIVFVVTKMYTSVPVVQEKVVEYTDKDFNEENIYSDLKSLAKRLDEEILGDEQSFIVYLKDMDISEIDDINHIVSGIYGSGDTYQQIGTAGDSYVKVNINVKRNMNYYVLKAYKDNMTIPDDMKEAKILYGRVKGIIDECIVPGMTDYDKELALHDYLVAHCSYSDNTDQPTESDIYRAYGAVVNGDAVCNGYAEALKLLFDCVDIESKVVVGTADGVDHAWNLVKIGSGWYHLDATWDDPMPDQGDRVVHPYFNISDEVITVNHVWEKADYPEASQMNYNYYVYCNQYFDNFDDYKTSAYIEMVQHGNTRFEAVVENYNESDDAMQFLFDGSGRYSSINWQTFKSGKYSVVVVEAK